MTAVRPAGAALSPPLVPAGSPGDPSTAVHEGAGRALGSSPPATGSGADAAHQARRLLQGALGAAEADLAAATEAERAAREVADRAQAMAEGFRLTSADVGGRWLREGLRAARRTDQRRGLLGRRILPLALGLCAVGLVAWAVSGAGPFAPARGFRLMQGVVRWTGLGALGTLAWRRRALAAALTRGEAHAVTTCASAFGGVLLALGLWAATTPAAPGLVAALACVLGTLACWSLSESVRWHADWEAVRTEVGEVVVQGVRVQAQRVPASDDRLLHWVSPRQSPWPELCRPDDWYLVLRRAGNALGRRPGPRALGASVLAWHPQHGARQPVGAERLERLGRALAQVVALDAPASSAPGPLRGELLALGSRLQALPAPHELRDHVEGTVRQVARDRARMADLERLSSAWEGLYLPESVLTPLLGGLRLFLSGDPAAPTGTLLWGPPGTGKTEIARALGRAAGVEVIATSAAELKAPMIGGTEERVRELWKRIRFAAPCVLFVDECDAVFPDRGRPETDVFGRAMTETFLSQWQGAPPAGAERVWVIGATNCRERLDGAMISRLGDVIEVPLPDARARAGLLGEAFAHYGVEGQPGADLVAQTTGLSGRDLHHLARSLRRVQLDPTADGGESGGDDPVRRVLAATRRRRGTLGAPACWSSLVLPDPTLERLRLVAAMMQHADAVRAQGLALPRGLLLWGPPGTGKTQVARVLAHEAGLGFVAASPADLKGRFVGHTAPQVRALFERARSESPAVVFLDELDVLAPVRGGGGDAFADDLLSQLLQELDGVMGDPRPLFVLGATNRPDAVDPALLSRFTERIEMPLPDAAQRRRLLGVLLADKPVRFQDPDRVSALLVRATEGLSGRDLRSLIEVAERHAFARALQEGRVDAITITELDFTAAGRGP